MKPFLKWAGGKARIVERIKAVLPSGNRLIEPFVGSGALFLNTEYDGYVLADVNADLINLYKQLQYGGKAFIEYCHTFFQPINNSPEAFYCFRKKFNETEDLLEKSALFVYLNKHCYNGLCRYNSRGKFNVPFGRYKNPYFPREEMLYFYHRSREVIFLVQDFYVTMKNAVVGDVIYCDPPYVPLSQTAHFTSYSANKFEKVDQTKLASLSLELMHRGIPVVLSNHLTEFTEELYTDAKIIRFDVQRNISCNINNRSKVVEILALFKIDE